MIAYKLVCLEYFYVLNIVLCHIILKINQLHSLKDYDNLWLQLRYIDENHIKIQYIVIKVTQTRFKMGI